MVTIKVESAGFLSDLERSAKEAAVDAVLEAWEAADRIAEGATHRAPRATGQLAESIASAKTAEGGQVRVESDHAPFVEFGTANMRAQPYLRPAISDEAGR
jgi:HK97 gp10 family phage protein